MRPNSTHQPIILAGREINLSHVCRDHDLDQGYLSNILSGKRVPSIPYGQKIAKALGLTLDELMAAIEVRKSSLAGQEIEAVS